MIRKKSKNTFDFLRGREKTRVSIFHLRTPGKDASPELNEARSEIHTIVTYDTETHSHVKQKYDERFEVNTFETQNWKQNFLDIWVRFFLLQFKNLRIGSE